MARGDRFPSLTLHDREGRPFPLRVPERGSIVLFAPHAAACEECHRYLTELDGLERVCRIWDGRRVTLARGGGSEVDARSFPVVPDPDGELSRRLGVGDDATLVIADRFGEIYDVVRVARDDHDALPSRAEIEEWLTFLGTQCPECDVPDTPGPRPWAAGSR